VPTEKVLQKLLPHTDSAAHKKSSAWIHVAPAIQGDIRNWFEAAGWTKREDWPKIASAILSFLKTCADNPSTLASACQEMVQSAKDRGYGRWSNQRNGDDWTAYDRPMLVCLLGSDRLVREYVGEATC
jgi:hypothetical protein